MSVQFARRVEDHDLVSFDVFDTLVLRAVDKPTDVFSLVKTKLLTSRAALLDPNTIDAFPDLRVRAELLAREAKARSGEGEEVGFDDIYAMFARLAGAAPDVIELLKRTELDTEHEVVYANPTAAGLFACARASGKPVVLCSDMYLPSEVVRSLLRRCGYEGYDELYVSCEHACSKHLGTMFAYVARERGVAIDRVLHVGDNPHGDVTMAERAGCTAFPVPCLTDGEMARMPWNGEPHFCGDTVSAIVAGITRKYRHRALGSTPDRWEEIGFRIFGPLFTGFLLWLRLAIEQKRPDRVLLFARDTQWITGFLDRFLDGVKPPPSTSYVHVSRGALLLPSMTDFPLQRLDHLFSGRVKRSLAQHLRRYGLEVDPLLPIARAAGFSSIDEVVLNGDPRMRELLAKVQHLLLRESARRRPLVQEYLEQFVTDAKDVMLVDIGWVGNMQASFVRLLASRHPAMKVRGYYVGVFGAAADNLMPGHPMQGWLTQPHDSPRFEQTMWWAGGVELLEFAMTASHGTTLGYERRSDGAVVPILEVSAVEEETARLAMRLQRGAAAFIEEFLALYGRVPPDGLNSRAWAAAFHRLVTDPSAADAELLGDLTHSDAAGDTALRLPLAPKVPDPRAAGGQLEQSYWMSGFIVRNGLDQDESYDEAVYLALHPDVRAAVAGRALPSGYQHWVAYGRKEGRIASWAGWMRRQRDAGAA